jgi:phenylacetate-CoA ligase
MYATVCKFAYLPLVHAWKKTGYHRALREALRNQHLPREELERLTLTKLRALLEHAESNCPYYRDSFRATGVRVRDLRSLADFRAWPRLSKREVFDHGDELKSSVFRGKKYSGVTSGSTGTALRFEQDSEHVGWVEACQDRGHSWWGIGAADRRLILWGRPVVGGTAAQARSWLKHRLRNSLSFNTFEELNDEFLGDIARSLLRFRPKLVYGYASSIGALAEFMQREGITVPRGSRPLLVEYTGDHMFESERETAVRVFGAPVASLYASSEAGSLSYQCPAGRLHISVDHIHVELLRDDGTPAAPGEQAEIVVTTLNARRMPFIRYRVGDLGSFNEDQCSCGVTLPLLNLEVGKVADRITTSTKKLVSSYVVDYIAKHITRTGMPGIRQFQLEQTGLDDFVLHVVRAQPFDQKTIDFFVAKMREYLGESIRTTVRYTDAIPMSATGKRRWFKKSIAENVSTERAG